MRPRERPAPFAPPLVPSRFRNQRITRKETTANVSREGMLMEGSSSTILFSEGLWCDVRSAGYPRPDARRVKLNEPGDDKDVQDVRGVKSFSSLLDRSLPLSSNSNQVHYLPPSRCNQPRSLLSVVLECWDAAMAMEATGWRSCLRRLTAHVLGVYAPRV